MYNVNEIIMYLRKSRSDNPNETVEEVLSKHETILQEFCYNTFHFRVPEDNIYREVVSGESIADRTEIKKVLSRIEDSNIKAILTVEPQRLTRGDLLDCGLIINTLLYTGTVVITPIITYDMSDKYNRRFFQDELIRGRDYYEYIKEILARGKVASAKKGCYLASSAPYGYNKVKIDKNVTLVPNDKSDNVRMIYQLFISGMNTFKISNKMSEIGETISPSGIDRILTNNVYIGKISYGKTKRTSLIENGTITKKRALQESFIVVDGLHKPIIDIDTFNMAQELMNNRPRCKRNTVLLNEFAGLLRCSKCGKGIRLAQNGKQYVYRCQTHACSKLIPHDIIYNTVIQTLEQIELPRINAMIHCNDDTRKTTLRKLNAELERLQTQEETQYELLETKQYSVEVFEARNSAIKEKISNVLKSIEKSREDLSLHTSYEDYSLSLSKAITSLKDDNISPLVKNALLKSLIKSIELTSNQSKKRNNYDYSIRIILNL